MRNRLPRAVPSRHWLSVRWREARDVGLHGVQLGHSSKWHRGVTVFRNTRPVLRITRPVFRTAQPKLPCLGQEPHGSLAQAC